MPLTAPQQSRRLLDLQLAVLSLSSLHLHNTNAPCPLLHRFCHDVGQYCSICTDTWHGEVTKPPREQNVRYSIVSAMTRVSIVLTRGTVIMITKPLREQNVCYFIVSAMTWVSTVLTHGTVRSLREQNVRYFIVSATMRVT